MKEIAFQTGDAPVILLRRISGDLRLSGWERPEFSAEGAEGDLTASFENNQVTLESKSDATVRVPQRASVTLQHVGGDARIKSFDGPLTVVRVSGDLNLRKTGPVSVEQAGGDLTARKVSGDLKLNAVTGNVSVRDVLGRFSAGRIAADLYLRGVTEGASAHAAGNVSLNLHLAPGQRYEFRSGQDLTCRIQPHASARVTLQSGSDLAVQLAEENAAMDHGGARQFTLGAGEAGLDLSAGGELLLAEQAGDSGFSGEPFDEEFEGAAEEFSARLEAELNSRMAELDQRINAQLAQFNFAGGMAGVDAEAIARKTQHAVERAREQAARAKEQAEHAAERARDQAERKIDQAQRKVERIRRRTERGSRRGVYAFSVADAARKQPGEPVSNDERLVILKMLESGTVTVAQAEKLLAALEGKE